MVTSKETQPDITSRTERGYLFSEGRGGGAKRVIDSARKLANKLRSPVINTGHILWAIADNPDNLGSERLQEKGVPLHSLRKNLRAHLFHNHKLEDDGHNEGKEFSQSAQNTLKLAQEEAMRRNGHRLINTYDLLLGIIQDGTASPNIGTKVLDEIPTRKGKFSLHIDYR
ncbi:MAG: hypothetical protein HY425_02725 [Candidatus Levybacteria bacterium]|nr:hypothetical protein [Candidatus Levybacteria bacterium]